MANKKAQGEGKVYIVMGVSGSGKSTIAPMLAKALELPFFDGDHYHPPANVEKMAAKTPLTDEDRHDWLLALNALALENREKGAVIVCSALKKAYREKLSRGLENQVVYVFLSGNFELIQSRLELRKGHFMPPSLLQSQFETLEPPKNAVVVSIDQSPDAIVRDILNKLGC